MLQFTNHRNRELECILPSFERAGVWRFGSHVSCVWELMREMYKARGEIIVGGQIDVLAF